MLKVSNFGAACCVIESDSFRILCDPWLVGTAYLGAWEREHYLPDPVKAIGKVDVIWISHLHDDHLSIESLRLLRQAQPDVPIWIGPHCRHLERLLKEFNPVVQDHWRTKDIMAYTFPSPHEHSEGVDSYLVVMDGDSTVANLNDLPFHDDACNNILRLASGTHLTALLPYAGAGPWPQCFDMTHMERWQEAEKKKAKFIAQFQRYKEALHADVAVPFSAGYVLRGPLAALNDERGIPDPTTIPGATVLPVEGAAPRPAEVFGGYEWENDPLPTDDEIYNLIDRASARAPKVSGSDLTIGIYWESGGCHIHAASTYANIVHETIYFDARLLAGMLRRKYHANSIEIGSCVRIKRHGAGYDPRVWSYLYRFHI